MVLRIAGLVLFLSGLVLADPIVITMQGVATGNAGSTDFIDAEFTLTVTTDTSDVTPFNVDSNGVAEGYETDYVSGAEISIAAVGSGTFTDTEQIFVDNVSGYAGMTDGVTENDLLDGQNTAAFESQPPYDLSYSIGPVDLGSIIFPGFSNIPTSFGSVTFTSVTDSGNPFVIFTATVMTAPEQRTLLLCAAGALLLAGLKLLARVRRIASPPG